MAHHLKIQVDVRSTQRDATGERFGVLTVLCVSIAALAIVATLAGLFYDTSGESYEIVTDRGATVEIDGAGLYRHDSILRAGANRGSDVLTLTVGIPLLLGTMLLHQRGSIRGTLALLGSLAYVLYVYATLSLGTAYNTLFLLYVALFGASLAAFIVTFASIDQDDLAARVKTTMRPRIPGVFMIASGVVTLGVWLVDPVAALVSGTDPELLEHSTTLTTHALDLAIIVPAAIAAGWLILRGQVIGYLMAMSLLVIYVMLAPMISLQTVFQLAAGVTFGTAEIVGPIGGFVVLSLLASWVILTILRNIDDRPYHRQARLTRTSKGG